MSDSSGTSIDRPATSGRRGRGFGVLIGALVALVLVGGVYVAGFFIAGDRVPRNASVGGVSIGGLDQAEAEQKLTEAFGEKAAGAITLTAGDAKGSIDPAKSGLGFDPAASVSDSGAGRSWNPMHIWRVLTGGGESDPVSTVDESALEAAVASAAKDMDADPKDATVAIKDAKAVTTKSTTGVTIDQVDAARLIRAGYLEVSTVEVPAEVSQPALSTEQAETFAKQTLTPALSADVTVDTKNGDFTVTKETIATAAKVTTEGGQFGLTLDADALLKGAAKSIAALDITKPKDAYWQIRGGSPALVPAVDGTSVSKENLVKAVEPVLGKSGKERTATVELSGRKADYSTEDAKKEAVTEVIGTFTTYFPYAEYRNINLGLVASAVDNTYVKAGDTFSMDQVVGERTAAKGYVDGYVISGGVYKKELAGGVSQGATTLFNAGYVAGLKDVAHTPHSLYINRYPAGREATAWYGQLDVKFQNDTTHGIVVTAVRKKASPGACSFAGDPPKGTGTCGSLTVTIWGTKMYDRIEAPPATRSDYYSGTRRESSAPDCEYQAPTQGFTARYHRTFYSGGKEVKREDSKFTYNAGDEIVCKKD